MRMRLLRFGFLALSVSPLFVACGSDSNEFRPSSADAGEGGEMDTPAGGDSSGGEGTTMTDGGAGGAAGAAVEDGGAGGAPPAVAGAGQGGEGGTPYVCNDVDQDGDGVSECDGDCKPEKPQVFPGNPEVCGDGLDNDCSFVADDPCGGLGTYVSVLTGDDANPGTKLLPVKTIAQGMTNAQTIMATTQAPIDVFVAQGDYIEKVVLVDGVSLLGAHNCSDLSNACDWFRDPSLYTSTITNTDLEGVLAGHTVFASTKIDGFTIVGLADGSAGAYPGTAAITVDGGSPTISNNTIAGGNSTVLANWFNARSVGIAVLAPTNDPIGVIIENNTITAGSSNGHSSGILFDAPGTTASPFKTYAVVTGNTISAGTAPRAWAVWAVNTGDGTLIQDNTIAGGQASGDESSSWGIYAQARAAIDGNRINLPPAAPSCTADDFCGGVFSLSSTSEITNNVILGVGSAPRSAGVYLTEIEVPAGSVVLSSNTIDGGGNKTNGENLSAAVALFLGGCCGNNGSIGRIANNILVAGLGNHRFGLWETDSDSRHIHPDWLFNNAFYNETSDTPAESVYYNYWNGTTNQYVAKDVIDEVNTAEAQFVTLGGNIDGDCALDATYHLQAGSACIDAGVSYDAPAFDYEGDARPVNDDYDIGADEAD